MAKIKEVSYEQVVMPEQYKPIRISATAIVNDNESPESALEELKKFVKDSLRTALTEYNTARSASVQQNQAQKPAAEQPQVGFQSNPRAMANKENKPNQTGAAAPIPGNGEVPNF